MQEYKIICKDCGCEVTAIGKNKLRCDICAKKRLREQQRLYQARQRQRDKAVKRSKRPKKIKFMSVDEIDTVAMNVGMSYGKYVALHERGLI